MSQRRLAVAAFVLACLSPVAGIAAQGDPRIVHVDHTFAAGSRWTVSFRPAETEGLLFTGASYQPAGGILSNVLFSAHVAQLHVPYLPGSPRFLDLNYGLGVHAVILTPEECSGGTLYSNNKICVRSDSHGFGWKFGGASRRKEVLEIFMSSQIGAYNYINKWDFHDDGTIEPQMGLTGQLQVVASGAQYLPYGFRLNAESEPTPQVGIAHLHNVYYRLVFFREGTPAVSRMTYESSFTPSPDTNCSVPGQCGTIVTTPILTETAQRFSPSQFTTWLVYRKDMNNQDGRPVGYEIIPHISGLWRGMTSTSEPWAGHDMYVTLASPCETLATNNRSQPHPGGFCPPETTPDHVFEMVNGESLDSFQKPVLWYVNRHLHVPRDEDQTLMPVEWMSFEIKPRGFYHTNPAP
jgi:primary-amine oxidase